MEIKTAQDCLKVCDEEIRPLVDELWRYFNEREPQAHPLPVLMASLWLAGSIAGCGPEWTDRKQLLQMPTIQKKMEKEVFEQLAGLAHFEMPKKVALLEHDFSIERGELTPTLKVKRRVIDKTYKATIDALYTGGGPEGDVAG